MKKLLLLATMVLGVVSCMKDHSFEAGFDGEEAKVLLSVALPDAATRGGVDSAVGAIGNIDLENDYDIRYILAVYDNAGNVAKGQIVKYENKATSTQFELRLVPGRSYRFVVWADFVEQGKEAPLHYDASDLEKVKLLGAHNAMDESRDAYTAVEKIDYFTSASEINMTLTRPFAKLRVVTNDMDQLYSKLLGATVEYTSKIYTQFNALTAEASEPNTITKSVNYEQDAYLYAYNNAKEMTLFADYLFGAVDNKALFSLTVTDKTGMDIPTIYFNTNIPVQRNHLTTIYGPIMTDFNQVTVTIDDDFAQPEFEYTVEEDPATGVVSVVAKTVDGLVAIATKINNGELAANTNITLGGDIDLSDNTYTRSLVSNWAPIGTSENPFTGTFDGRGYSIKNLVLVEDEAKEGKAYIGFFGYAKNVAIKNVTFENVYINIPCLDIEHSQGHIGAVAGSLEGTSTIENVTVKGDIKVYATQDANGASRVAVVAGGNAYGDVTMKNVHVIANEGSYLTANNNTGALAGQLQGKMVFENCSSNINVTVNKFFAGGLVGIAAGDSTFTNCHTTGDVAVVAGREGRHNDEYRVGGIAGGWADGKTKVCTLTNCTYTGKVSGKNADGAVAEPLDYAGYVGRGYTLANCAGSKVVIDDVEYVQVFDNLYGVYSVNGKTILNNDAQFKQAITSGMTEINLGEGTFNLPASLTQKEGTLTITGMGSDKTTLKGAVNTNTNAPGNYANGVELVFNNLKLVTANNGYNGGFGHAKSVTFSNSEIIGQFYAHSNAPHYFYDCTIDPQNGYLYTYGSDCIFEDCTFRASEGRALQVYEDGAKGERNVTITNCTFTAAKQASTWDGKPVTAIDINSVGAKFNVRITNSTSEGFPVGLNSGSNLWNVKDGGKAYANVYVDGVQVWYAGYENLANGLFKKDKTYVVVNANGLVALSNRAIAGNETVELAANIDLTGVEFNGLSAFNSETPNTFDGKNFTVSNWNYTSKASDMGFCKSWVGTIKNVKFENCHLKTAGRSAIVAGNTYCNIYNVVVNDCSIEDSYWACGIVAGLYNSGNISNCTVTNSSVKSNGGTGGIVGVINETGGVRALTNCSVSGCTINNTGVYGEEYSAGALVGMFNVDATFKFTNCSVSNNTLDGKYVYEKYPANDNIIEE